MSYFREEKKGEICAPRAKQGITPYNHINLRLNILDKLTHLCKIKKLNITVPLYRVCLNNVLYIHV